MSFSNYTENKVLELVVGKTSFTLPTVYVGLSSTTPAEDGTNCTEPSGGSYARVATTGSTWGTASAGSISNALAVTFGTATSDWVSGSNLTYVVLYDAVTSGNFIGYGSIATPKPVLNGDTASFAIGNITLTLD